MCKYINILVNNFSKLNIKMKLLHYVTVVLYIWTYEMWPKNQVSTEQTYLTKFNHSHQ